MGYVANSIVSYTCNECGYYGTQDGGLKPFVYTKEQLPNCTVTDPIWALLASRNISKDSVPLIDQSDCQQLNDYLKE